MFDFLERDGYQPTQHKTIYAKPDFEPIQYSDGADIENQMLSVLRRTNDLSVHSPELAAECVDWPTTYHFSSLRANLVRPFKELLRGDVVELGAGCGGVTRYLAEVANSVTAVEGSALRSQINAERNRDLSNVAVVMSELSEFKTRKKFDVVVVVGVLEYAALFIDGDAPHLTFLKRCLELLKPSGRLLLAIENKVGLKYFIGAPEDHTGVSMFGIEDRYHLKGVRTFSRRELSQLFYDAGFESVHTHTPIPDYKLVRAVISQSGLEDVTFNSGELNSQLAYSDPQLSGDINFDPKRAWGVMGNAGLDLELANSFLVEASPKQEDSLLKSKLAFYYGTPRAEEFAGEKIFFMTPDGIKVSDAALNSKSRQNKNLFAEFQIEDLSHYEPNSTISNELERLVTQDRWSIDELKTKFIEFDRALREWAKTRTLDYPQDMSQANFLLDGCFVDLGPRNVKTNSSGEIFVFDLEWKVDQPITFGYLVFRWINDLAFGNRIMTNPQDLATSTLTKIEFISRMLAEFGQKTDKIKQYCELEFRFQRQVNPALKWNEFFDVYEQSLKFTPPKEKRIAERDAAVAERDAAVAERDAAVAERDAAVAERDAAVAERDAAVAERDAALFGLGKIENSKSWAITRPVRQTAKLFLFLAEKSRDV